MPRIDHQVLRYEDLFNDVERGRIQIPQFQRSFVWSKEQTADLIDSIIKGFPIGTFIFWRTNKEELRYVENIGNVTLPPTPNGELPTYILDGQQRIASLYLVREGGQLLRGRQTIDYKDISIDLDRDIFPDDDEPVVTQIPRSNGTSISVYDLLNSPPSALYQEYDAAFIDKIDNYSKILKGYRFPIIVISEAPIDIACEIFTRINTGGTELTLFEIMVAKTYDEQRDFDLAGEYTLLIDGNDTGNTLKDLHFDTISASTILQCIAAAMCKKVSRKDVLRLDKSEFIGIWQSVKDAIFDAVDYLQRNLAEVSRLLPYENLLIPFTYFFLRNNGNRPDPNQDRWLKEYFWWASLSQRFGSSTNSRIEEDLDLMDKILAATPPSYQGRQISVSLQDLKETEFRTSDAFCKAVLCLYADCEPRNFDSNGRTVLRNPSLSRITGVNYHHFFPRSYLSGTSIPNWSANSILNITIVDDNLNQRIIRARPPSDYMREFQQHNPDIDSTMETHLIDDLGAYGIWNDDYETFITHRGERVLEELDKRLNRAGSVT
jgi:hypothetical protein